MKATVQTYTNREGKQGFKVVAPYMEDGELKSKIRKFNPSVEFASHSKPKEAAKEAAVKYCAAINSKGIEKFFVEATVADAIKLYLAKREKRNNDDTLSYDELGMSKYNCNHHIAGTSLIDIPVNKITASHCEDLIDELRDRKLSTDKIRRVLFTFKSVMDACVFTKKPLLDANPTRSFTWIKQKKDIKPVQLIEIPAKNDLDTLIINSTGVEYVIYSTAPYHGLRWQEWAALKWSDIGWNSNTINVNATIQRKDGKPQYIAEEGKTLAAIREVPLLSRVKDQLAAWKADPLSNSDPDDFVYGVNHTWIPFDKMNKKLQKKKKELNLKWKGGSHSFRHFFASLLIEWHKEKILSSKDVTEMIGHKDFSFTLKRYAKCFRDQDVWVSKVDRINATFEGGAEVPDNLNS